MNKKEHETRKRIVVDLDVITLAFWDKKDEANLIERIKTNKFEMITPYILLEHLSKWNHKKLASEITGFYKKYSTQVITAKNLLRKIEKIKVEYAVLLNRLVNIGVKEEDVVLVIISSIFDVDYLITFNRRHLKNKQKEINEVLKSNGIKTIQIKLPSEI